MGTAPRCFWGQLNRAVQATGLEERRPEQPTGIFRTRSLVPATFLTAPELPQHGQRERDARVTRRRKVQFSVGDRR